MSCLQSRVRSCIGALKSKGKLGDLDWGGMAVAGLRYHALNCTISCARARYDVSPVERVSTQRRTVWRSFSANTRS
ncbi:MAG: hypothetical protein ACREDM_00005, partial [Methylocella sp.]